MDAFLERLKGITSNFTAAQLATIVGAFVVVVAIVAGSAWWLNKPEYALLFSDMDAESAAQVARWWADVIGGDVIDDERGYSWLERVPGLPFDSIDFVPVPEPKTVKNRIHWDITSDDVDGIIARGATVLAEPTAATPWHVLADPDGNEFCVFPPS